MNAVLTVAVLAVLYMVGTFVPGAATDRPIIGAVVTGSPAQGAGLVPGDEILMIDGTSVPSWKEADYLIALQPDKALNLRVRRDGEERDVAVRSETTEHYVGDIGVRPLVRVGEVLPDSPAREMGLQADDAILRIDDTPIETFNDIPPVVQGADGRALSFRIWRAGAQFDVSITPRDEGSGLKIGVGPKYEFRRLGPWDATVEAVSATGSMIRQTFDVIGRLVTAQISPKTMMGPVGIAQVSGQAARTGARQLFFLVAVISLQVGILNLLPLVPLDGGHIAILTLEGVARRDLSPTVKAWVMNAGAAVIFLLIGLVLYSDISKLDFVRKLIP
jgi:regulator of sigma E protease